MADLKRKILDGAAALIAEQGVRGVSFREVARRAEVSHQAPYHHFGDYQGILRALAAEGFNLLDASVRRRAAAGTSPLDQLFLAGDAYVDFAFEHLGHFRAMFHVAGPEPTEPLPEGAIAYGTLVQYAARAAAVGHGRGLPPEALAAVCWSMVHGLATLLAEGRMQAPPAMCPPEPEALQLMKRQVMQAFRVLLA